MQILWSGVTYWNYPVQWTLWCQDIKIKMNVSINIPKGHKIQNNTV